MAIYVPYEDPGVLFRFTTVKSKAHLFRLMGVFVRCHSKRRKIVSKIWKAAKWRLNFDFNGAERILHEVEMSIGKSDSAHLVSFYGDRNWISLTNLVESNPVRSIQLAEWKVSYKWRWKRPRPAVQFRTQVKSGISSD